MPAIIDSGSSGELDPGFGGGGPIATAHAVVRQPQINFSAGDHVFSAQVTYGFDQMVGEARVTCAVPTGAEGDSVTLVMGADAHIVQRFAGTIVQIDTTLAPHSVTMLCKGPLYPIEIYKNDTETADVLATRPGISFEDLVGAPSATLKEIVSAVLGLVPNVSFGAADLEDPPHIYGLLAPEEFTWGTHETAAAYLNRVLQASAGYRLFDSSDGNIYLKQTDAIPGGADIPAFQVGVDIFGDASHSTSTIGQVPAVIVQGYDAFGLGPASATAGSTGQAAFQINSTLIEDDAFAQEVADFWLTQVNRLQEIVRISTPRDDLIGPAQSHQITGLGADNLWVKSVTTEIMASGEFTQTMTYISGA